MVIQGVSTRKIAAIMDELCGTEFSKSTVSDLCKRVDPIVEGGRQSKLTGEALPICDGRRHRVEDSGGGTSSLLSGDDSHRRERGSVS